MDSFAAAFGPLFTAVAGAVLAWIVIRGKEESDRVSKKADPAARRERFYRRSFESSPVGLAILTPQGQWMKLNERLRHQLGYTREEILGRTIRELTHSDDRKIEASHIRKLMRREISSYALEKRLLCKDRQYRSFDVSMVRFEQENGGQELWQMVVTPVSTSLPESIVDRSSKLGDILTPVIDLAYIRYDDQGIIEDWNKGASRIFGYEKTEMVGRSRTSLYRDEDVWEQKPRDDLRLAISEGRLENVDSRVGRDGVEIRLKITIIPDVEEDRVTGFMELAREVDQARGVDQYRQSYERLRQITEERIGALQDDLTELRQELDDAATRETALRRNLEAREKELEDRTAELRILTDAFRKEMDRRRALEASLHEANAERDELGHRVEELREHELSIDGASSELAEPSSADWVPISREAPADRLLSLSREKQSGTLVVTSSSIEKRVFFDEGSVYSCTSNDTTMLLGEILLRDGTVSEDDHRKALEVHTETGIALGRILVLTGALDEQALELAMRRKTEMEILDVLTWTEGQSLFVKGSASSLQLVPIRLDVEQLLEEGLALEEPQALVQAVPPEITDETIPVVAKPEESLPVAVGQFAPAEESADMTQPALVPSADPSAAPNKKRRERKERVEPEAPPAFVASKSKRTTKFHLADCRSAQKIKSSSRVGFRTKKEAMQNGLEPCKTCLG